ncbi:MAG: hypothetical protein EWV48_15270 [Microcystis aeruginosa Ma_QC_C_20070823_S13]|nr:MAG: hypothetical protein EWV48_15270 [Microcystis aeruginosa Ma_QC_C_20070823_S13]TRU65334.1 MAG: hypothetical protein EWV56_01090 [Microcystis aeruginosa Ma_QC_C_20070823_S13D]
MSFVSLWFVPRTRPQDRILEYILPTKPGRANGFSIRDNWLLKPKKRANKIHPNRQSNNPTKC